MQNIDRLIYNVPCLDEKENDILCPVPSENELEYMSFWCTPEDYTIYVYADVKTDIYQKDYIEIIFYNEMRWPDEKFRRFIIRKDYTLPENDEKEFESLTHLGNLYIDLDRFVSFQEKVSTFFQNTKFRAFDSDEVGLFLNLIYYALHRSGPREILYKCGLERLAFNLEDMEGYNLIGGNPQEIFGMPLKLLHIINDEPKLINRMYSEETREYESYIYFYFSDRINNGIPSYNQWRYLEEGCLCGEGEEPNFCRKLYGYLKESDEEAVISDYRKYLELSDKLGEENPFRKLPKVNMLQDTLFELQWEDKLYSRKEEFDEGISRNNRSDLYEFEDRDFLTMVPKDTEDIIKEAESMGNCLKSYVEAVAAGDTHILFLRRQSNPNKSYVTIEVRNGEIAEARGRFNMMPSQKAIAFIQKFACHYGLYFEPEYLYEGERAG